MSVKAKEQGGASMQQDDRSVTKRHSSARVLATKIIELSGGTDNIIESTHCTTRLRLRLQNSDLVEQERLDGIQEIQGGYVRAGQLQIILGPALVSKVNRQVNGMLQLTASSIPQEDSPNGPVTSGLHEVNRTDSYPLPSETTTSRSSNDKGLHSRSLLHRLMNAFQFFSDIVVPIIPLFVGAGLLLGLLGLAGAFGWDDPSQMWFRILSLLTGSAFQLMAVLFGYNTAKRFGGTPALGAAVGIVMTHPGILSFTEIGGEPSLTQAVPLSPQFGYQGAIVPTVLATLMLTIIEKGLRRWLPSSGAVLLVPFLSFSIAGSLAVLVIEPLALGLGRSLGITLEHVFNYGSLLFGLLLGGVYSSIVITGLHHGFQAVEVGLISNPDIGFNFLLPIWSMANIAQAGAGLAVHARTRDEALRKIALPASITALFGITEPITYGVNLKLGRPFLGAAAGGATGGAYVAFHQVVANSFGLTGLPMIAFSVQPGLMNLVHYLIGLVLALATAFTVTLLLGVDRVVRPEADKLNEQA
ncbi:PTS system sucrose-specific IIC component [Paenibacillus sp. W4I10]|uniref:PTS transporter subunit EIIC n=1 Tax=Paenibacillus sp. W4I10 TaxID=3042298 RepID=UPI002783177C|nr:PTS transporter subunit EIIC [Paenibacillus sp. W4I10]MDQ0718804.1 PTS system sucrose-specific IIC component [Paenibacillus sp. W4I10]